MGLIKCCLNCDLRHELCHDSCITYLKEKANIDDIRAKKHQSNEFCITANKIRPQRRLGGMK